MHFIDKVTVDLRAGDGGNGRVSFRHEKFIQKGGPDGGDGGKGGNIVLQATRNENSLVQFRYHKELKAKPGQPGGKSHKHGRNGEDLLVLVPVGTVVMSVEGTILADLIKDGHQAVIAKGGQGGFGNAHFTSSRRQAPRFAEKGEAGEQLNMTFELKMIADVGLIGLPNAGKSTLLSKLSNARPEIADYPFTTLTPNLGVVNIDNVSVLLADIPGLIAGAANGKGLGHDFLRHIERTAVIVHLIDAYQDDVAIAYTTIKKELQAYQADLIKRPEIVLLNKTEGMDAETVTDLISQLKPVVPAKTPMFAISAKSGKGLDGLTSEVKRQVTRYRTAEAKKAVDLDIPVITLPADNDQWQVKKVHDSFLVTGSSIEQFARRTDFNNEEATRRLRDIMKRTGIMHELVKQEIAPGQLVQIAGIGNIEY